MALTLITYLVRIQKSLQIICPRETWFDSTVTDDETSASAQYRIVRNDRSTFNNICKNEGGVAIVIRKDINFTVVKTDSKTTLEIQIVRIDEYFVRLRFSHLLSMQ